MAWRADGVVDIGVHLQTSGRQAITHARHEPIINPDDPAHHRRLSQELPLIEALAVRAIDGPLGIETRSTVWQKHLYELAGFKRFLGPDVVATLAKGEALSADAKIDLPMISVDLRRRAPYRALTGLEPVEFGQEASILHLRTRSKDRCVWFQVHLDLRTSVCASMPSMISMPATMAPSRGPSDWPTSAGLSMTTSVMAKKERTAAS